MEPILNVLAVDDEPVNLEIYEELFEDETFKLTLVDSGDAALSVIENVKPNVILLDIMMPGIDGYSVCEKIRQNTSNSTVKILLVSGKGLSDERIKGYEVGADDYIVKPFDLEEMRAKVHVYLNLSKTETELKSLNDNLEKQVALHVENLLESEKMACIGQLAAGVSHEINNPVAFVNSNFNTLKRYINSLQSHVGRCDKLLEMLDSATEQQQSKIDDIRRLQEVDEIDYINDDIYNLLNESKEGLERVTSIVNSLRDFSSSDSDNLSEQNINKIMDQALAVLSNKIKLTSVIFKDYGELPECFCYSNLLLQTFINILLNATQALQCEGEISISTSFQDGVISIAIKDNGVGIHHDNLHKIFNPFFTTHPVGSGMGLGLSTAYGIIRKHKGTIDVLSNVDEGTVVNIKLPTNLTM